jgi:PEP-CTERM motif
MLHGLLSCEPNEEVIRRDIAQKLGQQSAHPSLPAQREKSTLNRAIKLGIAGFVLLLAATVPAKADEIGNYFLEDVTFAGGGTASGSFSFDFTKDAFAAVDINTQGTVGTPNQLFTFSSIVPGDFSYSTGWCKDCSPLGKFDEFALNNGTDILWLDLFYGAKHRGLNFLLPDPLDWNVSSDLGYDCTADAGCAAVDGVLSGFLEGSTSRNPMPTPEPSTSLLLLMGCLGLGAVYGWRRKTTRNVLVGVA